MDVLMSILMAILLAGGLAFLLALQALSGGKPLPQSGVTTKKVQYTRAEVAAHSSKSDCWIVIDNKVYDVTPYVDEHPGGDSILANAGADSTKGFHGPQHASKVFDMVDEFYIGDLNK